MPSRGLIALLLAALALAHGLAYGLCVQDDAFITFRYAENLVAGHGLLFNPGERPVEGYTNFLWTVLMALPIAAGASPIVASVVGGLAATAGLVGLSFVAARRHFGDHPGGAWLVLAPPLFVAAAPSFSLEAVQGLETALFALLAFACLEATAREMESPGSRPWSAVWGALAALTRPEGLMVYGVLQGLRLLQERRLPGRAGLAGWGIFVAAVGAHLTFRLAYYGYPVPNTFYAKTGGGAAQWVRGLEYVGRWASTHPITAALTALGALQALRARRSPRGVLAVGLSAVYLTYVISVGGDFKVTWRFFAPFAAPLALVAAEGLGLLRRPLPSLATVAAFLAIDVAPDYRRCQAEAAFRGQVMEDRMMIGRWLRDAHPADSLLAIHSSGVIPYATGFPTIDMWGLSDLHIARVEMPEMGTGMAGHEKSDFAYVFGREPDLFLPEQGLLTAEPKPLPVPAVDGFGDHYERRWAQMDDGRYLNYFGRKP